MQTGRAALGGAVLGAVLWAAAAIAAETPNMKVMIDNFSFTPAEITIAPGTVVTWTNGDDIPHTITDAATQREFKSAALDTGDAFSHVFASAGIYHYFCSLHPHMQGTVIVK